jgi:hypothetical protein
MRDVLTHAYEDEASLQSAYSGVGIGVVVGIAVGPRDQASPAQLSLDHRL